MDGQKSVSPQTSYAVIGTASSLIVFDVRRDAALDADDRMPVSALRRVPEEVGKWWREVPPVRPVVVYCVHGQEVGRQAAAALRIWHHRQPDCSLCRSGSRRISWTTTMLQHGLTMYDAFCAWSRVCQGETHNWTPGAKV